jgi:hypothetical protein
MTGIPVHPKFRTVSASPYLDASSATDRRRSDWEKQRRFSKEQACRDG